ncbi:MAG: imidazole glycerol phosphate synthase subunit HisH [Cyclobacteriaceae bacterium]|nr:imidazole glycerol phosphate synthase subunit HisH [Cyclobacteriaceae bacterium HetDA_MAG_MS6]
MRVAIVKYNAGNIQSLSFALNRLGVEPVVTDDSEMLGSADKVIFPGQGEASSAMAYLRQRGLDKVLKALKQPFLGVCLGMQLMCEFTEENNTECLGIIPVTVKRFSHVPKVPHMGWNTVESLSGTIMQEVPEKSYLYFVHSYYVEASPYTIGTTVYGNAFSTAVQKDNFHAIQPHPEKSADAGMKVLSNFLKLT